MLSPEPHDVVGRLRPCPVVPPDVGALQRQLALARNSETGISHGTPSFVDSVRSRSRGSSATDVVVTVGLPPLHE